MTTNTYKLATALHRLGRQLHRAYHHGRNHSYYREQSHLLILIAENDGIMQRDLAEKMDVRPSSMTEMLAKIETAGLIARRQDEKDQRVMHIFLTEQGKNAVAQSQKDDTLLTDSLFRGLADEEIDSMLHLTEKLSAHLNTIEEIALEHSMHAHGFGHRMCRALPHHHHHADSRN